jgi:hypothetical protein
MEVQFKDISVLVKGTVTRPFNGKDLENWTAKPGSGKRNLWTVGVPVIPKEKPGQFVVTPGTGAMINRAVHHGDSQDFYSTQTFGSCHLELEVMVPKGSNSGIYVMGEYEVQVLDSFGRKELGGGDMGAIYGANAPAVNASTAPGTWQRYGIDWQAPAFNENGKKIRNARFIAVELNGLVLHENVVMPSETPGGVDGKEKPKGPLMFQGNHGPVAYRRIVVTEW